MSKTFAGLICLIIGLFVGWIATYYTVRCQSSTVGIQVHGLNNNDNNGSIQITTTGTKNKP
ncbi:MAG: hypothetical protein P1U34_11265 [Coxiellaceae bacterium]|nr:hypothetical protein [Coxiellaceae bacterium]